MSLSKDNEICKQCEHYKYCNNKRLEACAAINLHYGVFQPVIQPIAAPIRQEMVVKHDYRNIEIDKNTTITIDLEEMKKKMKEDFYKNLGLNCLKEGV